MRICIVSSEYPAANSSAGGIGRVYGDLAPELVRQGHDVHVLTVAAGPPRQPDPRGVKIHLAAPSRRFSRARFLTAPARSRAVSQAIRTLGHFDAVYAPEWGGEGRHYSRRQASGPLVTHLHTSLAQIRAVSPGLEAGRAERMEWWVQERFERAQTEGSSAVVGCSRAILEWTRELWDIGPVRSTALPNIVDAERAVRLARGRPPAGFPSSGRVISFSGRLESRKGANVLGEAMRSVWAEAPDARLVMMGGDSTWEGRPMSAHLRDLAGERADRLHILGNQPHESLLPALAASDVVAFPSLWENSSIATLEALALGRAVVATDAGGFPEMIESGTHGLLVPPGDAGALAEALLRLLDDPGLRDRLGAAAAESVARYSPARVAREHAAFLASVAGGA